MADIHYRAAGDVVERQSFLNGTRSFLLEGSIDLAGEAQAWSLAVTLPKDAADEILEGDLTIGADGATTWCGAVMGGFYRQQLDEATDAEALELEMRLVRLSDAESSVPWSVIDARITVENDGCTLDLTATL